MAGRESLVHCIGGFGHRSHSVLELDLLEIITEDRVLKPELAALRRIREATDRPLCRDRAGLECEWVGQVDVN